MTGLFLMALIVLMTTACSANSGPEPLELTIEMSEFAFSPQDLEFQVGQEVTLHLINVGALSHEIMFWREVEMEDGQPNGYHMDMFESARVEPEVTMMEGGHSDDEEMHYGRRRRRAWTRRILG